MTDLSTSLDLETRRKRLRFRAWHRGFKEADLIMGRFADAHLESLSVDEVAEFERLLDAPDQDVYGWVIGREPTPDKYQGPVMRALQVFRVEDGAEFGDGPAI
ncbi:FAD assembly factor SdhE [Woodsholea maritima]|uniref:FAD assembly factor SdhE n=1 Tax=Woodsholea maritima TaxID=240237 RepID=UPI00036FB550|nr:succinate dehydrogenase assembly factor 2 [Woodsholea maritima]